MWNPYLCPFHVENSRCYATLQIPLLLLFSLFSFTILVGSLSLPLFLLLFQVGPLSLSLFFSTLSSLSYGWPSLSYLFRFSPFPLSISLIPSLSPLISRFVPPGKPSTMVAVPSIYDDLAS